MTLPARNAAAPQDGRMSAWLCPDCNDQLDRDGRGTLTFDLRDPTQIPRPGRCWGCGRRRLEVVPDGDGAAPGEEV